MRYMSGLDSVSFQLNYRADLHFLFHCFPRKKLFFFLVLPPSNPQAHAHGVREKSPRHKAGSPNPGNPREVLVGVNIWATCTELGHRGLGGRAGFRFLPRSCGPARAGLSGSAGAGRAAHPRAALGGARALPRPREPALVAASGRRVTASRKGQGGDEMPPLRGIHCFSFCGPGPPAARTLERAAWGAAFVGAGLGATGPGGRPRPRPSGPGLLVPAQTAEKMRANCILHFCAT